MFKHLWASFAYAVSIVLCASAAHAQEVAPGAYALKSDSGNYAARCAGCVPGSAYTDNAGVHEGNRTMPWARWSMSKRPNGRWVLQSDSGRFLARCNGCGPGSYPDSAFVHETSPDVPWAQWALERRANGRWVLKSDNGKYLARCNACFKGGAKADNAFVHETNPDAPWAQWTLESLDAPAPTATPAAPPAAPPAATATAQPIVVPSYNLDQRIALRNQTLAGLRTSAYALEKRHPGVAPWAALTAAVIQYGVPNELVVDSPRLNTLFAVLDPAPRSIEVIRAGQTTDAEITKFRNTLSTATDNQAGLRTFAVAWNASTKPAEPEPVASTPQPAPVSTPLFGIADTKGSFKSNTLDTMVPCPDNTSNAHPFAVTSLEKTCNASDVIKSYRLDVDCYHNSVSNTDTDNTVTVNFYSDLTQKTLVKSVTKSGVSCPRVGNDPKWSLDSKSAVTSISVKISGNNAFFIDEMRFYRDGTLVKHFGAENGQGWCLSTDPGDRTSWGGYVFGNECKASWGGWDFRLYDR